MGKLRNDFDAFKEQQTQLNQNMTERLLSLEVHNQNSVSKLIENTEPIATVVQIRSILEKLISFDDRIKILENPSPVNFQVKCIQCRDLSPFIVN